MGSSFWLEDEHASGRAQRHHPIRARRGSAGGRRWRGMTSEAGHTETDGANGQDEIRPEELRGVFAVPSWLSDLGLAAWLLAGITLLLVGTVFLLSLPDAIVMPVVTAAIIAAVLSPVVGFLGRHGLPRSAAAA